MSRHGLEILLRSYPTKSPFPRQGIVNKESLGSRDLQQNAKVEQNIISPPANPTTPTSINASENCRNDRLEARVDKHDCLIVLMSLLVDEAYQDQLSFLPDGKSFVIKHNIFSRSLMSRYFNVSSFSEFLRVLKRIGFTQIKDPTISDNYTILFHPYFQMGNEDALRSMRFLPTTSHRKRKAIHSSSVINLSPIDSSKQNIQSMNNQLYTSNRFYFNNQKDLTSGLRDDIHDILPSSSQIPLYHSKITTDRTDFLFQSEDHRNALQSRESSITGSLSTNAIDNFNNQKYPSNRAYTTNQDNALLTLRDQSYNPTPSLKQVPLNHNMITMDRAVDLNQSESYPKALQSNSRSTTTGLSTSGIDALQQYVESVKNQQYTSNSVLCDQIDDHLSTLTQAPVYHDRIIENRVEPVIPASSQYFLDDYDHTLNNLSHNINMMNACSTISLPLSESFDAINKMTRDVVSAAVQCLLND